MTLRFLYLRIYVNYVNMNDLKPDYYHHRHSRHRPGCTMLLFVLISVRLLMTLLRLVTLSWLFSFGIGLSASFNYLFWEYSPVLSVFVPAMLYSMVYSSLLCIILRSKDCCLNHSSFFIQIWHLCTYLLFCCMFYWYHSCCRICSNLLHVTIVSRLSL